MTREIALHCMKSYSELHSDLCELCPIYGETGSDHCFEDALEYVIGMLEQEQRWVPVSERLPEKAFGCIVTVEVDNILTGEPVPTVLPYVVGYDGETWNDADGIPIPYEVIAWMPLPKPYKAESEEKE